MRALPVLLALLSLPLGAAEIAVLESGAATVAEAEVDAGKAIDLGQVVATPDDLPAVVALGSDAAGRISLAPGSALTFESAPEGEGDGKCLRLRLHRGAIQVDLKKLGPWKAVRVWGAAIDVRVTGTLFCVERVRRDADYVAMVEGRTTATLQPSVAEKLGRQQEQQLTGRQGLAADYEQGLGGIDALLSRPQIAGIAGQRADLRVQALAAPPAGGLNWHQDDIAAAVGTGPLLIGPAPIPAADPIQVGNAVFEVIGNQVVDPPAAPGAAGGGSVGDILVGPGSPILPGADLAGPPGHP